MILKRVISFKSNSINCYRKLSSLSELRHSNFKKNDLINETLESDILIIGDGLLANSIAYWLRSTNLHDQKVIVLESENYSQNKFNVPINNQFNSVEAIQLGQFTNKFLRRLNAEFKLRQNLDINLKKKPSNNLDKNELFEKNSSNCLLQLTKNIYDQNDLIRYNKLFKKVFGSTEYTPDILNAKQVNETFNWFNEGSIHLARYHSREDLALTNLNLQQLNQLFKEKANQIGISYLKGKIKKIKQNTVDYKDFLNGLTSLRKSCNEVIIENGDNLNNLIKLKFNKIIIASSADQSKTLADSLGLTKNNIPWPVENRQRFIYEFECKELKNKNVPVILSSFGLWLKKDPVTGNFFTGLSNNINEHFTSICSETDTLNNFSKNIWPYLTNYVPALKNIEMINVHRQNYDYNLIDDNFIIGLHPELSNCYWIIGAHCNHEIWAPGLGKAMQELVYHKRFTSINLEKFGWQKIMNGFEVKQSLYN